MTALYVIVAYMAVLVGLGLVSNRMLSGTGRDFFVASSSIGPVFLLLSIFGTTMTAFAMVGSTGQAYEQGIGVFGLMASWSGLTHPLMFWLIGVPVWHLGRRYGYLTQSQWLRDRFQSDLLGWILFPILVLLVLPYLLIGLQGAGATVGAVTKGAWTAPDGSPAGLPSWLTGLVVAGVVLSYVFSGGMRAAVWANAFQTLVFIVVSVLVVAVIADGLGGPAAAMAAAAEKRPDLLVRTDHIAPLHFLSYGFVGLSVGTFPHIYQHWLTARSSETFKLTVALHPVLILLVWLPCVLLGVWAGGQLDLPPEQANRVLGVMVARFSDPMLSGVVAAGVLAAIMSTLDSQFVCLSTMFVHDVVKRLRPVGSDAAEVAWGRAFVVLVVAVTYGLSLLESRSVFDLGVWCFSGFAGLTPLAFAALYWRRATAAGAIAAVLATAGLWVLLFLRDASAGAHGEPLVGGVVPAALLFAVCAGTLVLVSLATRAPDEAHLRRFFRAA